MQTTSRPRENGASFAARRGHNPHLSISDDNHHVTETIGYMYDDESDTESHRSSTGAPIPNRNAVYHEQSDINPSHNEVTYNPRRTSIPRKQIPERQMSNGHVIRGPASQMRPQMGRGGSWERQNHSPSPPPIDARERSGSDTATSPFPLNDIDYESSPAAVAQELSNLQALRRMSMNLDVLSSGDPDLPQLNAAAMPSSPSHSEDDSSRLFWVPARLHPELAPKEFKSFLDSKAEQIKRRSGELSQFQSPASSRSSSLSAPSEDGGGLRRKKSMLSRQIHNPAGYQDGADRLEQKRLSINGSPDPNLEELESLVNETQQRLSVEGGTNEETGDIILPSVPGASLKRSRRTNYRRPGSVKGKADRGTYAQRMARKAGDETPTTPSTSDVPPMPSFSTEVSNLASTLSFSPMVPSETTPGSGKREAYNFSRPALNRVPSPPAQPPTQYPSAAATFDSIFNQNEPSRFSTASAPERRPESMGRTDQRPESLFDKRQVPQIVEVPPPEDQSSQRPSTAPLPIQPQLATQHPARSSSRESTPMTRPGKPSKQTQSITVPPSSSRPISPPGSFIVNQQPTSLEQPSALPGNNAGTSELTFIPTLTVDKRADHKTKEESKKSGWSWLLGKEDSKDKDKPDKPKAKITKPPQSDNTRLDVLQTSIEGQRKESLVLDRDGLKLEEERKKESIRKSSEGKKEKDGFLSSIFGGKKAKEKEAMKRMRDRLSPEPTARELKPDIDYNWTRFSILEERAIYRMAHIKLANPRRALYSQVLLSNFMYSYLAKVQQMHPQMNLPTSARQQRTQQQQQQPPPQPQPKQAPAAKQPDEFTQYQRYQQVSSQSGGNQNANMSQQQQAQQQEQPQPQVQVLPEPQSQQQHQYGQYEEETPHAYDHDHNGNRPVSRGNKHAPARQNGSAYGPSHGGGGQGYYHQQQPVQQQQQGQGQGSGQFSRDDDDDDEMW